MDVHVGRVAVVPDRFFKVVSIFKFAPYLVFIDNLFILSPEFFRIK